MSAARALGAPLGWLREAWGHFYERYRPRRRVLPTRAGGATLMLPMVLGIAAINASNNLLFILVGACLGMITLSGIVSEQLVRTLEVEVRPAGAIRAAEAARLVVRVLRRAGGAPMFDVRIIERLSRRAAKTTPLAQRLDARLALVEGAEGAIIAERVFPRRGPASLAPLELRTRYPFGLLTKACDLDARLDVLVRPRAVEVPAGLADPGGLLPEGRATARRGAGDDFFGLRERDERDVDARVHALRSLRLGHEVVVETEATARPVAWLGVAGGQGTDAAAFERALELAQAALEAWDRGGWAVGLILGDRALGPEQAGLEVLLDALATAEPRAANPRADAHAVWLVPVGAARPADGVAILAVDAAGRLEGAS